MSNISCHSFQSFIAIAKHLEALLQNKPLSAVEVLNDIDGELVNLFMTVRDHPSEFVRHVQSKHMHEAQVVARLPGPMTITCKNRRSP